jgi:hypothetical protein
MLFCIVTQAQELNCKLTVNSDQVPGTNRQVFNTLEKTLNDFVNKNVWLSGNKNSPTERINCSMVIIVSAQAGESFTASIQIQSNRPVYNSAYSTPVFNYNDKDFSFNYQEYQQLIFNPDSFDSNLMSVIAFYCYMIIGIDNDTFALNSGSRNFAMAQQIANIAQTSGYAGWSQNDGPTNRYFLINDLMSNTFSPFRETLYNYHIKGLDVMSSDVTKGKTNVKESIMALNKIYGVRPNSLLVRVFFDAKSNEIVSIFSGGPSLPVSDLVSTLNRISPTNSSKWTKIK